MQVRNIYRPEGPLRVFDSREPCAFLSVRGFQHTKYESIPQSNQFSPLQSKFQAFHTISNCWVGLAIELLANHEHVDASTEEAAKLAKEDALKDKIAKLPECVKLIGEKLGKLILQPGQDGGKGKNMSIEIDGTPETIKAHNEAFKEKEEQERLKHKYIPNMSPPIIPYTVALNNDIKAIHAK